MGRGLQLPHWVKNNRIYAYHSSGIKGTSVASEYGIHQIFYGIVTKWHSVWHSVERDDWPLSQWGTMTECENEDDDDVEQVQKFSWAEIKPKMTRRRRRRRTFVIFLKLQFLVGCHCCCWRCWRKQIQGRAVVVAQLAERSAVRIQPSANFYKEHLFTYSQLCWRDENKEKEAGNGLFKQIRGI